MARKVAAPVETDELPEDIARTLAINIDLLDDEMIRQPARYASWALRAADAVATVEERETAVDRVYANLDAVIRIEYAEEGRKVTEESLKQAIRRHPNYITAQDEYLNARSDALILQKIEAALKMRAEMLVNLSANQRREIAAYQNR